MIDIGSMELLLLGFVALLVIGPKRLPEMAQKLGQWWRYLHAHVSRFKSELRSLSDELSKNDFQNDLDNVGPVTGKKRVRISFNPRIPAMNTDASQPIKKAAPEHNGWENGQTRNIDGR